MTGGLAFVVVAIAVTAVAPPLVSGRAWAVRHPAVALRVWAGALAAAVLASVGAVGCAVGSTVVDAGAAHASGGTWPVGRTVAGVVSWAGLVAVGAMAAAVITRADAVLRAVRETDRAAVQVVASVGYRAEWVGRVGVSYVRDDAPWACAAGGQVLVSSGAVRLLPVEQVRALVEHERAHLRRHDGLLLRVSLLGAECFPFVPAAVGFRRAARLLVELAADDAAAAACGPAVVCTVLDRLGRDRADEGMRLRADRLAGMPVHRRSGRRRLAQSSPAWS